MLSVLRSPIRQLYSEELVDIRIGQREMTFYEAMVIFSAQTRRRRAELNDDSEDHEAANRSMRFQRARA